MSNSKLNYFFSNLNVLVILTGYPLVTTIFIPMFGSVEGSTQLVTIPFRLVSLIITIITLVLNYNKSTKYSLALKLFIFFLDTGYFKNVLRFRDKNRDCYTSCFFTTNLDFCCFTMFYTNDFLN